ncbi:MAG TPA: flagellar filament capping protein FliD [Methylobacter sp.]
MSVHLGRSAVEEMGAMMSVVPVIPAVNSQANVAATPASGQTEFAATENEARLYIDIFNGFLQDSPATNTLTAAPGGSSSSLLLQLLNSQQASKATNGKPLSDSLTAIGIGFQQSTTQPNTTGQLTLDESKLQAAFTADPSGTQAAVSQAVQSMGQISAKFSSFFTPDFSTSSTNSSGLGLFSQGGQSTSGDSLGLFGSSSDSSSIFDTLSQSPQLIAAQMLGSFDTGGATSSFSGLLSQGGQSSGTDFLSAFNTGSGNSSIWDIFSQSPQLAAAQILGTLPKVPQTKT